MASKLILLGLAGGLGTLARYGLSEAIQSRHHQPFPWGTFAVNALGCLLYGLVFGLAERRLMLSPEQRLYLLVGFMGGFTTFSSFAFEAERLIAQGRSTLAALNVAGQNAAGVLLVYIGLALGRR